MIFLFWVVVWFVQLYFLNSSSWLGVTWPLFIVITLILSKYMIKSRMVWWLLALGIIADLSSHQISGLVFRGYIILALGIGFLNVLQERQDELSWITELLAVVLVSAAVLLGQSTSWNSMLTSLRWVIWLYLLFTIVVYFLARFITIFMKAGSEKA